MNTTQLLSCSKKGAGRSDVDRDCSQGRHYCECLSLYPGPSWAVSFLSWAFSFNCAGYSCFQSLSCNELAECGRSGCRPHLIHPCETSACCCGSMRSFRSYWDLHRGLWRTSQVRLRTSLGHCSCSYVGWSRVLPSVVVMNCTSLKMPLAPQLQVSSDWMKDLPCLEMLTCLGILL